MRALDDEVDTESLARCRSRGPDRPNRPHCSSSATSSAAARPPPLQAGRCVSGSLPIVSPRGDPDHGKHRCTSAPDRGGIDRRLPELGGGRIDRRRSSATWALPLQVERTPPSCTTNHPGNRAPDTPCESDAPPIPGPVENHPMYRNMLFSIRIIQPGNASSTIHKEASCACSSPSASPLPSPLCGGARITMR